MLDTACLQACRPGASLRTRSKSRQRKLMLPCQSTTRRSPSRSALSMLKAPPVLASEVVSLPAIIAGAKGFLTGTPRCFNTPIDVGPSTRMVQECPACNAAHSAICPNASVDTAPKFAFFTRAKPTLRCVHRRRRTSWPAAPTWISLE